MSYPTIFHQPWWLDAAAGDQWVEVRAALDSGQWASLKVFRTTKLGIPMLDMPPLSRTLGVQMGGLEGKPEARRRMKLFLIDSIVKQLPRHVIFNHVMDAGDTDALAFRLNGFSANVEYTYRLDNCTDLAHVFANMRDKMRNAIRRAQDRLVVEKNSLSTDDFIEFHSGNLAYRNLTPNYSRVTYKRALKAAFDRGVAEIFSARGLDNRLRASICTVFDERAMYYLLTTQDRTLKDNGSVAVLIWNAIASAGEKGLAFDFDGFGDRGAAAFLSQFGGTLSPRLRVNRMPRLLQGLVHLGPRFAIQS